MQSAQFVICTADSEAVSSPIHCVPMVYQGISTEVRLWLVVCYILLQLPVFTGILVLYIVAEGVVNPRSAIIAVIRVEPAVKYSFV